MGHTLPLHSCLARLKEKPRSKIEESEPEKDSDKNVMLTLCANVMDDIKGEFHFRWSENSVTEIGKATEIPLISHHLN